LREPNLGKTNPRVTLFYSFAICFAPSLANSIIFLTLTRLVVVINFVNFSFALFTPSRRLSLRNMSIGDVCPKESEEPPQAQDQPSSSNQASPPTQDEDQAQDDENEDQEEPPQEEDNDQGEDANDQDKEDDEGPRPPHPSVHQAIQRDHPVNSILGDIHKGVTTRSRVAHFCEYYSFVSSIEPYRVEDTLRDSDWVLAMQEELNNFTRNEVWHLVPRPNQNVVGTKWVFHNK
jgi:hypothetical protein